MLVVFVHLSNVERKNFPTHLTGLFQFGNLGVDLFFVISGVVISTVTAGKFANPRGAATFIKHRLSRIFPIYWFYCFIFLVGYLVNPLWFNNSTGHRVNIVDSFLLIPTHGVLLIMQGWTLSYELYFYLMFSLMLCIVSERLAPVFLSLWGASIVAGALLFSSSNWPVLDLAASPLILEFLAGCLVYHIYHKASLHPHAGTMLVAISFLWLSSTIVWTFYAHRGSQLWIQDSRWARPFTYGVFAAIFLLGLMELERSNIIRFARPFEAIGNWSYSIYLSHLAIVEVVGRVIAHFAVRLPFAILLVYVVSIPLVLLVGYLSYNWIEVPLMNLLYKGPVKSEFTARSLAPVGHHPQL